MITAIKQHRTITTNGPFLDMTIGTGHIGDTITAQGGAVDVKVSVHTAQWDKVDHLVIYANSAIVAELPIPAGQGASFDTTVHLNLTRDSWVVAEVTGSGSMFPVVTPTEFPGLDATVLIKALSVGLDLSSLPLTSNLKPERVHVSTPYAITNPIWVDTDGNGWTPPKPPFARAAAPAHATPDVRAQFDALPEVSQ